MRDSPELGKRVIFSPFFNLVLNHPGFPIGSSKDLGQEEGIEGAPPGTFLRDP